MNATLDVMTCILRDKFNVKKALESGTKLSEMGLDSLDVINFLFSLEEAVGVKIPDEAISDDGLQTLADIAVYVDSHR